MDMIFQLMIPAVLVLVALIAIGIVLARLYRRSEKDRAYVRTGFGGQKVVLDGGSLVLPVFHIDRLGQPADPAARRAARQRRGDDQQGPHAGRYRRRVLCARQAGCAVDRAGGADPGRRGPTTRPCCANWSKRSSSMRCARSRRR